MVWLLTLFFYENVELLLWRNEVSFQFSKSPSKSFLFYFLDFFEEFQGLTLKVHVHEVVIVS